MFPQADTKAHHCATHAYILKSRAHGTNLWLKDAEATLHEVDESGLGGFDDVGERGRVVRFADRGKRFDSSVG